VVSGCSSAAGQERLLSCRSHTRPPGRRSHSFGYQLNITALEDGSEACLLQGGSGSVAKE
jgi:hypothetical protein